jgi:hypothetical protein
MAYAKRMEENPDLGYFINVMQFSSLWRIATGERGNLFKEMQMFNQMDTNAEGVMNEADFVKGNHFSIYLFIFYFLLICTYYYRLDCPC